MRETLAWTSWGALTGSCIPATLPPARGHAPGPSLVVGMSLATLAGVLGQHVHPFRDLFRSLRVSQHERGAPAQEPS